MDRNPLLKMVEYSPRASSWAAQAERKPSQWWTLAMSMLSFAQLEKNYGREGAEIIVDNLQDIIFGGFAPNSNSAEVLSKALGSRTVMSGSVSRSKNDPSQSLQMIERPLMTADELKSMPKGQFIVMKTGFYPMKVRLKLYFDWGIQFDEQYAVPENGNRKVSYAEKNELLQAIVLKYHPVSPLRL